MNAADLALDTLRLGIHTREGDQATSGRTLYTLVVELQRDGVSGYGLTWAFSPHRVRAVAELVREFAPIYQQYGLNTPRRAWQEVYKAMVGVGRAGSGMTALSVLDMAAWDCQARRIGLPLYQLLGAVRDAMPVYLGGVMPELDDESLKARIDQLLSTGVRLLKMSVGVRSPREDAERVLRVRRNAGEDVRLIVDAAGRFDRDGAVEFARRVEEAGLLWLEDPVDPGDEEGFRRVAAAASIPLAGGQFEYGPDGVQRYADRFPVEILIMDVTRVGGVTGWMRAAAHLEAKGKAMSALASPHIHLSLLLSCGTAGYFQNMDWWDGLLGSLPIENGKAYGTTAPGWGFEIPRQALAML